MSLLFSVSRIRSDSARSTGGPWRRPWLGGLLLALSAAGAAFAHDPMEITADAVLKAGSLELRVTMARSTAEAVIDGAKFGTLFDPSVFAALQPRFEKHAAKLFAIASGGAVLVPRHAAVTLTVENDVEFRLDYPRAAPGLLRFEAVHVAKLADGYGDLLTVQGEHGELLGQKTLMGTDLVLEAIVPAARASSPPAPVATAPESRGFRPGLAVIAAIMVGLLGYWLWRRPPVAP